MLDFDGFDWDSGNWPKCGKHGVGQDEIEGVFFDPGPILMPAPDRETTEFREVAFGRYSSGSRPIMVIFTRRVSGGKRLIRPISTRYMHAKEARRYEQTRES